MLLATLTAAAPADPLPAVLLGLTVILLAARAGGALAQRLGQPAVLGELVAGVLLGNLGLVGVHGLDALRDDAFIDLLADLGVLVLLFQVGLEATVAGMMRVGASSLVVALLGVAAPIALGWGASAALLPAAEWHTHLFLGTTLCATSVGITARVLKDLGRSGSTEAHIILGAAVIDDVLGLMVLAVVSGMIVAAGGGGAAPSTLAIGAIIGKAVVFLAGALVLGVYGLRRLFAAASHLRPTGLLLALGLASCFAFSWLAHLVGLAPIVGAFAAGLVLEPATWSGFTDRGERSLDELVAPISSFLVPVFFVVMGMRTDLASLASGPVLLLAAALTVVAIAGKQVCSLGVLTAGTDRITVGLGMIPRGEVGLIFAAEGRRLVFAGHPVLDESTFSALVVMVIATTLLTPPALAFRMRRLAARAATA